MEPLFGTGEQPGWHWGGGVRWGQISADVHRYSKPGAAQPYNRKSFTINNLDGPFHPKERAPLSHTPDLAAHCKTRGFVFPDKYLRRHDFAATQSPPIPISTNSGTSSSAAPSISRFTSAASAGSSSGGSSKTSSSCT